MREVKDLRDSKTGEKFYPKSHAKAVYLSDGRTVEDAIDEVDIKIAQAITDELNKDF